MWRDPQPYDHIYICRKCRTTLQPVVNGPVRPLKCNKCERNKEVFRCPNNCLFEISICVHCQARETRETEENNTSKLTNLSFISGGTLSLYLIPIVCFVLLSLFVYRGDGSKSVGEISKKVLIENLRKDFPAQKKETWFHFLSVLEKEVPSVKSITLLHGNDTRTSDCLTRKLVTLYSGNKSLENEEGITFSADQYEAMDYGFALEHYHSVVQNSRVLVTNLTKVPGSVARIFHSLCDEISSDIKPSLFIFTLKFDGRTEKLKPLERAVTILKEAWSDLPENEIFPLLSRVIKIVVDVVPEKGTSCP